MVRQGRARQGRAGQGKARQSRAGQGRARQGKAGQGKARQGKARQGISYNRKQQCSGRLIGTDEPMLFMVQI